MATERTYRPKSLTYSKPLPGGAEERLRELILYVAERCEKAALFGMIKLNKIIWRADFRSFQAHRVPITGVEYHRIKLGPAPVIMRPVLESMRDKGQIEIESQDVQGHSEKRVIAVLPANLNYFADHELEFIEEAIAYYWDKTGKEASDDSHGVAWKTRADKQKIPYEAVFLNDEPISKETRKKFAKLAHEKRWVSR